MDTHELRLACLHMAWQVQQHADNLTPARPTTADELAKKIIEAAKLIEAYVDALSEREGIGHKP